MEVESQFRRELEMYWRINPDSASVSSVWDALKAFSRGQYQTIIEKKDGVVLTNYDKDALSGHIVVKN